MNNYNKYINITAGVRFGKPCIIGTRITVFDVLGWLANGMNREEIIHDFPEINAEQINACLAYASDREHKLIIA
jgi:uncharacterized protein (DUF433 family)